MTRYEDRLGTPPKRDPRFVTVSRPQQSEGIGRALQRVYCADKGHLPEDMLDLLGKLDRH